jgi:hypothetical protein
MGHFLSSGDDNDEKTTDVRQKQKQIVTKLSRQKSALQASPNARN